MKALYLIIPFAPLIAAIVAGLFARQLGRLGAHTVTIVPALLSCLCSCVVFADVLQGHTFNGTV
jgi:NADH-quinone oxidoreductase subunit L